MLSSAEIQCATKPTCSGSHGREAEESAPRIKVSLPNFPLSIKSVSTGQPVFSGRKLVIFRSRWDRSSRIHTPDAVPLRSVSPTLSDPMMMRGTTVASARVLPQGAPTRASSWSLELPRHEPVVTISREDGDKNDSSPS